MMMNVEPFFQTKYIMINDDVHVASKTWFMVFAKIRIIYICARITSGVKK